MVKNEQDVIGPWVQHLLDEQFAGVIVADNMSTDDTRVILDQFTDPRLHVMDDPEVGYYQGEKTSRMGQIAAEWGATWIVPVDADEWWFSTRGPIGEVLTDPKLLCMVFRIAQSYEVRDLSTADTVRYQSVCIGTHQMSGLVLGSGMGECSTGEYVHQLKQILPAARSIAE